MPKLRLKEVEDEVTEAVEVAGAPVGPIFVLTREDLIELSLLLRVNLQTKDELFLACQRLSTINVEGQEISLEPRLLQRLHSRCAHNQNFGLWLKSVVVRELHAFVGW